MAKRTRGSGPTRRTTRPFQRLSRTLGKRVHELRIERGWTQRSAAAHIGIGPAVVRRLETGLANPSLAVLVSVARAFRVPLTRLLGP
jgi:transcriptional regulator with XRE-family HTH domain